MKRAPVTFDKQVKDLIKPVYETLASDDLFKRCLGGNNKSLCMEFCSEVCFYWKNDLLSATLTVACIVNEGVQPVLKIME
ncbi:hypothetical protein HHI36_007052, partial [Cryptolaemus montrouzieri]